MSVSATDVLSTEAADMYSEEVEEEELGEEEEELGEEQEASATVRHTRRKRAKPEPPMSAEEAWATADAEGLKLVRAPYTVSGCIHVSRPIADVRSGRDYQVRCPDQFRRRLAPATLSHGPERKITNASLTWLLLNARARGARAGAELGCGGLGGGPARPVWRRVPAYGGGGSCDRPEQ